MWLDSSCRLAWSLQHSASRTMPCRIALWSLPSLPQVIEPVVQSCRRMKRHWVELRLTTLPACWVVLALQYAKTPLRQPEHPQFLPVFAVRTQPPQAWYLARRRCSARSLYSIEVSLAILYRLMKHKTYNHIHPTRECDVRIWLRRQLTGKTLY